jgi:hypothetical protein
MTDEHRHHDTPEELLALRQAMRPRQAPDRVEAALREQFQHRQAAARPPRRWWQVWGLAAAVATIVLAVLVMQPSPAVPEPPEYASQEIASDYLPIGYATPLAPDEFAQVIRVSVPRSDMVQFGLPVRLDQGPERVTADVVVGEDGIARAIRFVQ